MLNDAPNDVSNHMFASFGSSCILRNVWIDHPFIAKVKAISIHDLTLFDFHLVHFHNDKC